MSQLDLLQRLQEIDSDIAVKKARLTLVLKAQRETEALLSARARFSAAEKVVAELKAQQQDFSLQLGALTTRVQQSERRLYSGKIQSPKELEDLQDSIEALKRQRSVLEDEALEVMVLLEDANAEKESAEVDLAATEAAWNLDQAKLREEQNTLALALHGLLPLRTERAAMIRPDVLRDYDSIARRSRGIGITAVSGGRCAACHVSVPANKLRSAQQGAIEHCINCGRIMNPT